MNRTDRLYALREELRRAGPTGRTADQLAARFEVSTRTIKRDISTLQHAGFPVHAHLGRNGRYLVEASATLPPITFTPAEVAGLAAALLAHRGQPFDGHGQAALTKILNIMSPSTQARTAGLADRIWINDDGPGNAPQHVRAAVETALEQRLVLAIRFTAADGQTTSRHVDPQLLAHTHGHWYLIAYCRLRQAVRWFRLDRIEHASTTKQPARELPLGQLGQPPQSASSLTAKAL